MKTKIMRSILIFTMLVGAFVLGANFAASNGDFVARYQVEQMFAEMMDQISRQNDENTGRLDYILTNSPSYNNAADIFRAVDNSVVSISSTRQSVQFGMSREANDAGSGIIFYEDDERVYIATNYHVVQNATRVTVSLDDIRTVPASFVGGEERSDIAVISVLREDLAQAGIRNYQVAAFGDSDAMEIGNFVLAVGNAYGEGKSATLGIVSAMDVNINLQSGISLNVLQTDAAINPGNSGGPLVNTSGEVIGINTARLITARSEGMGYAIPSNEVVRILAQIMERGNIETPILGVFTLSVNEEIREHYSLDATGLFITQIINGYAAQNMGVRIGDIVTHYNGVRILNHQRLGELISNTPIGGEVVLTVMRNGNEIILIGEMTAYRSSGTNF